MKEVSINKIIVGLIAYRIDDSQVIYNDGQGVLKSDDDILDGYIRDSKIITVVTPSGKEVRLEYKVDVPNKRVLINNSAAELA
ncbi:hypothetical protein [Fructilactobacillus sanfranciscensis]|uniref:Uncharacterized protein n=2 Tax=Fructilactobacillus sanfranciscensis TaxID=1625 RepID=G2KTC5_FRUST|nr:hypothetical protein [Fructilactobacillus sanfranciscensis]AEN98741.1 hypothetical protein LSA_02840 [Fructilactobacillus sanfranciscensis TMW 1.1304]KRM80849.1 hypothetical protein FD36_GL000740 [Fructilactobacillus sanfranciscensis DSM 20451]MCG7194414.1 hypothetical protein [Fructilactobacillus sanfranciscensis]MCG7195432.1 hypothetical protein [Fructilactobacillus sanfranciscensis]MDN4462179.1 hypothetical protein [Fructilactobacillus sanfranciscensis]